MQTSIEVIDPANEPLINSAWRKRSAKNAIAGSNKTVQLFDTLEALQQSEVAWSRKSNPSNPNIPMVRADCAANSVGVCLAAGTHIATSRGAVRVEDLNCGDMVQTADHGLQPVLWVCKRHFDTRMLHTYPGKAPIKIPAGTFGNTVDACVSPMQGILVGPRHGLETEMFVRAKHLIGKLSGVRQLSSNAAVTYLYVLLPQHEVIYAEGMPSESFYPGLEALYSLQQEAMQSLTQVLPAVGTTPSEHHYGPTARPFAKRKDVALDETFNWGQSHARPCKLG